ncbi:MAG: TetR family transcriptional regulator [Burkholderiaceae bacterium]|nr:TetR family transcriptional regulator [Burkholderiaceae bacterium]
MASRSTTPAARPARSPEPVSRRVPARAAAAVPGPNRRLEILLAAEKLFAQRGFHAVSIRDIAAEAGVPLALVGYHYGAKHELYHAIFESWRPSIERRRALLTQAMAEPAAPDALERVIEAFVGPLVALHADPEGRHFAAMAARDLAAPTPESEQAQRDSFDPLAHAFIDALQQLFPRRTRAEVAGCYQFMLGAALHFLSDVRIERLSRGTARAADPARQPALVAFVAAGFRAVLQSAANTTGKAHR